MGIAPYTCAVRDATLCNSYKASVEWRKRCKICNLRFNIDIPASLEKCNTPPSMAETPSVDSFTELDVESESSFYRILAMLENERISYTFKR